MNTNRIRERLKKIIPRLEELRWRNHAMGEVVDLTAVFRENKDVFSLNTLYTVAEEGLEDGQNLFLYGFLLSARLEAVTSLLDDRIGRILTESTVKLGSKEFPYNMAYAMIAREEKKERRSALRDAMMPVHDQVNQILLQKDARVKEECEKIGRDYISTAEVVRLADLKELAGQAREFLDLTEDVYKREMDAYLRAMMGFGLAQARRYDIPRLFFGHWTTDLFPKEKMVDGLYGVLRVMGLDPTVNGQILVDTEERPKKMPRASCFGIQIPTDVRLSVKPIGGFSDYDALFHEMGHAQHFANTDQEELEFRYMGSLAISETYAFTIEGLLEKPEILVAMTGMNKKQADEVVRFKAVQKLFVSRRYAAKMLYEMEWHSGRSKDLVQTYSAWLSRAYGFPLEHEDAMSYLIDHDDLFYSADYLRAWYMQVLLDRMLSKGFGARWFQNKDAGQALKALWALGQKPLPRELADVLDGREFDAVDYAGFLMDKFE